MENKIIETLSKKRVITTYLALSACVLKNVRSIEEQHNLDIALVHLLSRKEITQEKDSDGFTVFKLAG
jgi:DNA-dependent RNA polymerase auxiliary subunit epsilon